MPKRYLLGRTFMHGTVRNAILAAYAELNETHPELRFCIRRKRVAVGWALSAQSLINKNEPTRQCKI